VYFYNICLVSSPLHLYTLEKNKLLKWRDALAFCSKREMRGGFERSIQNCIERAA
jgi:hypothetical protein